MHDRAAFKGTRALVARIPAHTAPALHSLALYGCPATTASLSGPSWARPPSNGKHDQLSEHHFHTVLDRLETIKEARSEVRFYPAVKLGHAEYAGCQIVHSSPFSCGRVKPRKVNLFG